MFDGIDFSFNLITHLGEFPLMPQLRLLILADNRLKTFSSHLESTLPNLESLVLYNNNIDSPAELLKLQGCKKLTELYIHKNPIAEAEHFRQWVIQKLPQVKVLNGSKIKDSDRVTIGGMDGIDLVIEKAKEESGTAQPSDTSGDAPEAPGKRKAAPVKQSKRVAGVSDFLRAGFG